MKSLASALITFACLTLNLSTAYSATPREFLEDTKDGERGHYVFGALETAMIMNDRLGNNEKSACIKEWFAGHAEEANKELIGAIHQVKDRDFPVAAVILILIDKHCEEAKSAPSEN